MLEPKVYTALDLFKIETAYNDSQLQRAPIDAQKNSDITKAEIEAKLIGEISTHSHDHPPIGITYNIDDTVNVVTTQHGTKTMLYNVDGTLAGITGTGIYHNKTFVYTGGHLTNIIVS